jgi:hypothetical protein
MVTQLKGFDISVGAASSQCLAVGTSSRCRSYGAWRPLETGGYKDVAPAELDAHWEPVAIKMPLLRSLAPIGNRWL